jgi:hypothetical protein
MYIYDTILDFNQCGELLEGGEPEVHHLGQGRPLGSPLPPYSPSKPPRDSWKLLPLSESNLFPLAPEVPLLDTEPARPLRGL